MAEAMPSTPHMNRTANPPPNRRLWTSPAISDYFSGDDASIWSLSPETSVLKSATVYSDGPRAPTPESYGGRTLQNSLHDSQLSQTSRSQRRLLQRLNSVGRSIITGDLDDEQCLKLGIDVDRLESTISAPESQSREPAEDEITGLFNDDVTESSTIVQETASKQSEAHEVVQRVLKTAAELKQRFLEIKHTNDLATAKLEAAAREITVLRKDNEDLRNSDSQSEILYLRLRLNSLEERAKSHLDRRGQEDLIHNIEQLSLSSTPQKKSRKKSMYPIRSTSYSDDVFVDDSRPGDGLGYRVVRNRKPRGISNGVVYTNGQITPIAENVMDASPLEVEGLSDGIELDLPIAQVAEPQLSQPDDLQQQDSLPQKEEDRNSPLADSNSLQQSAEDAHNNRTVEETKTDEEPVPAPQAEEATDLQKSAIPESRRQKPQKSPWQMLWDDLAEFSGMRNDEDEDVDDEYEDDD